MDITMIGMTNMELVPFMINLLSVQLSQNHSVLNVQKVRSVP